MYIYISTVMIKNIDVQQPPFYVENNTSRHNILNQLKSMLWDFKLHVSHSAKAKRGAWGKKGATGWTTWLHTQHRGCVPGAGEGWRGGCHPGREPGTSMSFIQSASLWNAQVIDQKQMILILVIFWLCFKPVDWAYGAVLCGWRSPSSHVLLSELWACRSR